MVVSQFQLWFTTKATKNKRAKPSMVDERFFQQATLKKPLSLQNVQLLSLKDIHGDGRPNFIFEVQPINKDFQIQVFSGFIDKMCAPRAHTDGNQKPIVSPSPERLVQDTSTQPLPPTNHCNKAALRSSNTTVQLPLPNTPRILCLSVQWKD